MKRVAQVTVQAQDTYRLPIFTKPSGTGIPKVRPVHGLITVMILRLGKWRAKRATVKWGATFTNGDKSLGWQASSGEGDVALKDEGITWIRGHHASDSKEVAALRVAHALESTS